MTIQIRAAVNAGTPTTGAVTVTTGDVVQFSLASSAGYGSFLWEIFSHPTDEAGAGYGLDLPSGWTLGADGHTYFYAGSSPPTVTIPALPYWGKCLVRCTPGGDGDAADDSLCLRMDSPDGLEDVAALEDAQADAYRAWGRPLQNALRGIGPSVAPATGPQRPDLLNDLVRFKLDEANGASSIANSGTGTAFSLDTQTGAGSQSLGCPNAFGDSLLIVGTKYWNGNGGKTYQPSATNFTASCWVDFKKSPILGGGAAFVSLFGKINATDSTFALGVDLDAGLFKCKVGAGTVDTVATGLNLIANGRQHLAMSYDGSNIRLYTNGVLNSTTAKTGTLDWDDTKSWVVGNAGATGGVILLCECKFANVVKTLAELKTEVYQGQGWNA